MSLFKNEMNGDTKTAKRGVMIMLLVLVLLIVSGTMVFIRAVVQGDEYKAEAERQQLSVSSLKAERGTIYDRNMSMLATSASVWKVVVNPMNFKEDTIDEDGEVIKGNSEKVLDALTNILGLDRQEMKELILEKKEALYQYLVVKTKLEQPEKAELTEFIKENKIGGVITFENDIKRYYPNGSLASTLLGFTGSDGSGSYGIEYYYDDELSGVNGRIVTAQDSYQMILDNNFETVYPAENGTSLVLTIDSEIQAILEDALATALEDTGATNVYGIVMATKTGAILAQSNMPDYDPNDPYAIKDDVTRELIDAMEDGEEKDKARENARYTQWKNKSIADFYEPGSVFKVFLVSAAMEEDVINENSSYNCVGTIPYEDRSIKDYNPTGHGVETPRELLINSCNTFSVHVGDLLGREKFYKYFEAFGFTQKTGIDIAGEGYPAAGVTYHSPEISFSKSDLASSSFGQSISVTPLQVITAISAIGNGGKLMQPYIVDRMINQDGNTVKETTPVVKRQVISERTAAKVASYMEDVVKKGTGTNAYVAGYHVACKTGTSEKLNTSEKVYIASTAGFAPCNDPEISVIIIIDEPKCDNYSGGVIAAPVAGVVFEKTLRYLGIEPDYTEEELANLTEAAPELVGLELTEAESELRSTDFTLRIVGNGDTVVAQSPEAGRTTPRNGVIVLYTEENSQKETVTVPDFTGCTVSQANQMAINNGLNVKISGSYYSNGGVAAYKQEYEAGTEVEPGTIITIYFRATEGILD